MGWGNSTCQSFGYSSESNEEDRDGIGRRDIYTFFEDGRVCYQPKPVLTNVMALIKTLSPQLDLTQQPWLKY